MAKKQRRHKKVPPTPRWIAYDRRQKEKLDREFFDHFVPLLKKTIRKNAALKSLIVPLSRLEKSVQSAAYGRFFGLPGPSKRRRG